MLKLNTTKYFAIDLKNLTTVFNQKLKNNPSIHEKPLELQYKKH